MFEIDPSVGVAPDQDGEEEGADDGRHEHDEQAEQSLATRSVQGVIVEPEVDDDDDDLDIWLCNGLYLINELQSRLLTSSSINVSALVEASTKLDRAG